MTVRLTSGRLLVLGALAEIADREIRQAFAAFPHEFPPRWAEDGTRRDAMTPVQRCEPTDFDRNGEAVGGIPGCETCAAWSTERNTALAYTVRIALDLEAGNPIKAESAIRSLARTPAGVRCVAARRLAWALRMLVYGQLDSDRADAVFKHVALWSTDPPQVGTLSALQIIGDVSDAGGI